MDQFAAGDLPGAAETLDGLATKHADSTAVLEARAYSMLLQGQYESADEMLEKAEATAGENVGKVKLRRALVALKAKDLDGVREHGQKSGLPAGALLAAEVLMADAENDEAMDLLRVAREGSGEVAETANQYLAMLTSDEPSRRGIAEATALWALGERNVACEAVEEAAKSLPDDAEDKNELLLVWAGRAVTSGSPGVAMGLLDVMEFPPEGQAWRVQATRALIAIADGEGARGLAIFNNLAEGGAPADGLADARATAIGLTDDAELAKQLAGDQESAAVARGLLKVGASEAAQEASPGGVLGKYLGSM
jgi:tetratricopeptide (TPR) repeat protein